MLAGGAAMTASIWLMDGKGPRLLRKKNVNKKIIIAVAVLLADIAVWLLYLILYRGVFSAGAWLHSLLASSKQTPRKKRTVFIFSSVTEKTCQELFRGIQDIVVTTFDRVIGSLDDARRHLQAERL